MVGAGNAKGEINLGMTQVLRQRLNVVQAPQINLNSRWAIKYRLPPGFATHSLD